MVSNIDSSTEPFKNSLGDNLFQIKMLKGLSLALSDSLSFDFRFDFSVGDLTHLDSTFSSFTQSIESLGYYSELAVNKQPVLIGISQSFIHYLTCRLIGVQGRLDNNPSSNFLFSESFVGHEFVSQIMTYLERVGWKAVFQKSEIKVGYFHPFHPEDLVSAYSLTFKVNQEPIGVMHLCFSKEAPVKN